jgi:hypothetical protein
LDLTTHTSLSPIRHGFAPSFVNYKKGCTRLTAASDKVYQGRWFYPGTPASSTTKTGRHDIAEILLKVALKHQKSNQSIKSYFFKAEDCGRTVYRSELNRIVIQEFVIKLTPLIFQTKKKKTADLDQSTVR